MNWLICLILMLLSVGQCFGGNLLGIFAHYGYSHFKVYYPLLRNLAERGHNVTIITYIKSPEIIQNYHELLLSGYESVNIVPVEDITPTRDFRILIQEYFELHNEGQEACENFYKTDFVKRLLAQHAQQPFDLVIMEYFNTDCYLAVPHLLKLPVVGLSSCALMPWLYERIALPDMPSYVQTEFIGFPTLLNWRQRLLNYVQARGIQLLYRYYTGYHDNKLIKKYLNIDVDVRELARNLTTLIFVNQHYALSGNRPMTPQLIEMGGVHIVQKDINATLPVDILSFLENVQAHERVLFISWGSVIRGSSLPKNKLQAIIKVLEKLPLKIIWKWEEHEKPTENDKFLFIKWAPQLTLLCHPKVNYFWGHGGLLGTTEAVYCGKPLLMTPIFGDQFLNAQNVVNREMGVLMFYYDIDEVQLHEKLNQLMNSGFTKNAREFSAIFRNRETTPLAQTTWWIEHLLTHGKVARDALRSTAVQLNWFVYYSLDSVALLLVGFMLILFIFIYLIKFLLSIICRNKNVNKLKTN